MRFGVEQSLELGVLVLDYLLEIGPVFPEEPKRLLFVLEELEIAGALRARVGVVDQLSTLSLEVVGHDQLGFLWLGGFERGEPNPIPVVETRNGAPAMWVRMDVKPERLMEVAGSFRVNSEALVPLDA